MRLDDLAAYRQAQAQADVTCGEERRRHLGRGIRGEAGAIIGNLNLHILPVTKLGNREDLLNQARKLRMLDPGN